MQRVAAVLACVGSLGLAMAQPVPDYGFEWRTVGHPGNVDASPADFELLSPAIGGVGPIGGVDYEFRMTRTEITVSQYLEFVQAYSVVNPGVANDPGFYGPNIDRTSNDPAHFGWYFYSDAEFAPAEMAWFYAARYCNWLTNGKSGEAWAFETGAYDMSSFVRGPDRMWTGRSSHLPGATFWIPTIDEWTKGMYYDPNRFGEGLGGYWMYPHGKNEMPVGGAPGTPGAETAAGEYPGGEGPRLYPVGSYPETQSPWGLLDGSGGAQEWNEWNYEGAEFDAMPFRGSSQETRQPYFADRLDGIYFGFPNIGWSGLRLASVVPGPASTVGLAVAGAIFLSRRKK